MAALFFNINNAVVSDNLILSTFNQFWSSAPLTNTSSVYIACLLVIGMCMYATGCRNLIYKVLNLAVLSVFVVALWAYLTDVTFIYVVYILTFVSAVVMLFLSVVLMLPSSAISISSTKHSSTLLTFIAGYSQLDSTITGLVFLLFPVVTYLSFAFYRTRLYRHNEEIYSIPKQPVNLELTANAPQNIKSLVADYHLRTFYDPYTNAKAVESCQDYTISGSQVLPGRYSTGDNFARVYNDIELSDHISNIVPSRFPLYVRVYPKHFFLGHQNLQTHRIVNLLLTLVYEFSDFYFKVIEPSILNDSKIYAALSRPLRAFVTSKAKALPTLWYDENGWRAQCRFNIKNKGLVIFVFDRPWWSPFQVFRTASNKPIFAESFQKVLEIIGHRRKALMNFGFIKSTAVTYSNTVALYILHIFNLVVNNLDRVVFKFSAAYAEMFAQLTTTLSVFLLGAPFGYPGVAASGYSSHIVGEVFSESLENLAAIQHQLYVISPMLMIVSVTGLLVALIGAPLFVSPGHATKKVAHKH